MRSSSDSINACRELLRHIRHPARMRDNVLFQLLCAKGRVTVDAAGLVELVGTALDELTPTHRLVLLLCDLQGERHETVASMLGLSRRQFYRQRASAFEALAGVLSKAPNTAIVAAGRNDRDRLELPLALSRSIEQTGDWRNAADYLERLAASSDTLDERFWIEVRLAELYACAGRMSQAGSHLAAARSVGAASPDCVQFSEAVANVYEAKAALQADQDEGARTFLQRELPRLRALQLRGAPRRVAEAFLRGLLVRSELAHGEGALSDALHCADEAASILRKLGPGNAVLNLQVRTMAALSRTFIWDEPKQAEFELLACYDEACGNGYLFEAATISVHLAGLYRLSDRPDRACEALERILEPISSRGPSLPLGTVLVELAYTYFSMNAVDKAVRHLCDAKSSMLGYDGLSAVAGLLESYIHFAQGRHREALLVAEAIESTFARLGRTRFVGQALVLQARALAAMGQRRQAQRVLRVAVEILEAKGQPLVLADARKRLAAL